MMKTKLKKLEKVRSFGQLKSLARKDPRFEQLAIVAAKNLGSVSCNLNGAFNWLECCIMESGDDELGVMDEVNFCRDLV